jgi:hypothetical protein
MKSVYVIPSLIGALGIGLLILGTSGEGNTSVFGFLLSSLVVRGLGLIVLIFSVVAFLAAYGSTLPPLHTTQHDKPTHGGDTHGKSKDPAGAQHLSRGA